MDRDSVEPTVGDLPGERASEWVEYHHEHAAPSTYVYEFVWDRDAPAIGPFCTDVDGNVLMDWTGHVGAMPLGYNNPKVLDPLSAFDLVEPTKIAGQDFYATGTGSDLPGAAGLMDRLTDISSHYGMDTVFLSNSGAEAVENAIKISYDHRRGKYAITFEGAFHGRTLGALSLNRSKAVYRRQFPEIATVHDAPFCDDRHCTPESCDCGFFTGDGSVLGRMLDPKTGHVDPDDVSYIIFEPIQGEGGYRFPSDAFATEIADIAERHGVPIVVDEVQTGLGRTGEWWGSDHYPFDPDVIASAKALRVGATIASADVFPDEKGRLSSTWGAGDVLACAQGALTIDAIEEYDLLDNATERGRAFVERFRDATAQSAAVEDVRGEGLLLAVEFDSKERREAVIEAAMQRGLLTLGCGRKTLRLLPPLDSTRREIELGSGLLADAIDAVA
ncbi:MULTISPECIES: aminotransferase class III-fold pyridoxal phosphate-dependent enzyme [Halomicrobium]|uniref:Aminotransferase class-III n=2 Tax=Halomicrobium mukohataei TaxID=57705 RepID=C7NWW0_HALMD|nr:MULTISPECIES: aminotransferase class III-fold pyridoxal phosphate-dependent enzyme [Halomicrobium]ACV48320.1 aminotransferase class-III [Halomicrobium mukohataei DSM 12286]QCD66737.1 aminotransferase class III-fold pyridoxal phosphate-dependent enzyme [Halomicrobium mukohataei]QFR21542.1 aminotransferase class III-fold pyridoxal phosphate-dependent enzyme [Halomicrobium sp. ZPS1]